MAAPLMITCDVRNMNTETKEILTNKDIIEINQNKLGKQAKRVYNLYLPKKVCSKKRTNKKVL